MCESECLCVFLCVMRVSACMCVSLCVNMRICEKYVPVCVNVCMSVSVTERERISVCLENFRTNQRADCPI